MLRGPMTSLSPAIQSVLDLFKGPLSSVRFADIDATGLESAATEVEAAASEVESQRAALAELEQGLAQRQEALLVLAQRALAYARVYAENDEPLLEELNRISLPRPAKARKPAATKATRDARAEASDDTAADDARSDGGGDAERDEQGEAASAPPAEVASVGSPRNNPRKGRGAAAQRATP